MLNFSLSLISKVATPNPEHLAKFLIDFQNLTSNYYIKPDSLLTKNSSDKAENGGKKDPEEMAKLLRDLVEVTSVT